MSNRLQLDFSLETNEQRAEFLQHYLKDPQFSRKPPTSDELETMANYVLYGRDPETGKNFVQEKSGSIATKHGTWDSSHETESLDLLMEQPTFNESLLHSPTETAHYITKAQKFSRSEALKSASPELIPQLLDLFGRIDWLDLQINFYDLKHGKRSKPIRDSLLNRFTEEEQQQAAENIKHWSAYQYLKHRHELVELRREQYALRDSYSSPILRHQPPLPVMPTTATWGTEIGVRPLGLKIASPLVFKEKELLIPDKFKEEELQQVSRYYWSIREQKDKDFWLVFDFRDAECVYQLFMAYFDLEDSAATQDIQECSKELIDTLNYYVEFAELSKLQQELLRMKMNRIKNTEIANYVNQKYGKNYTANYISTIFRQKIIPQINQAAASHEEIVGNLFFPEEFKTCTTCGRTYLRSADYFVRKSRSKDGLSNRCKKCDRIDRMEKKVIK